MTEGQFTQKDLQLLLTDPAFMAKMIKTLPQETQDLINREVANKQQEDLFNKVLQKKSVNKQHQEDTHLLKQVISVIWLTYCIFVICLFSSCAYEIHPHCSSIQPDPLRSMFFIATPFIALSMCITIIIKGCE